MKTFIFQAALHCASCAEKYMRENKKPAHVNRDDESSYDSDEWPKGPYPDGGGESDSPQNCDTCGVFLENILTPDGDAWLRKECEPYESPDDDGDVAPWALIADRAEDDGKPHLADWIRFYYAEGM